MGQCLLIIYRAMLLLIKLIAHLATLILRAHSLVGQNKAIQSVVEMDWGEEIEVTDNLLAAKHGMYASCGWFPFLFSGFATEPLILSPYV